MHYLHKAMGISIFTVLGLCRSTELRKKQLIVDILHKLNEFWKEFLNFIWFLK